MEHTTVHINIRVTGKVQGVWFRKSACEEAQRLGASGTAQNLPDGCVSLEVEGEQEAVDAFVRWCRKGPPLAHVDDLQVHKGPVVGHKGFSIRR